MKKIYCNPNIEVVKIETRQMLADSYTNPFGEGTKNGNQACARGGWFDEGEE